jgi:hypothetical protein
MPPAAGVLRLPLPAAFLGLLFALFLCGPSTAAAAEPAARSELPLRDMRLTLQARRTLAEDDELGVYSLGVDVQDGMARVWGSVHTEELAWRVVDKLRRVAGVTQVRSEVTIVSEKDLPLPSRPAKPPQVDPLAPARSPMPPGTLTGLSEKRSAAPGQTVSSSSAESSPPLREAVEMLRPIPAVRSPDSASGPQASLLAPAALGESDQLAVAVKQLIADARFRRLQCEIQGRTVTLRGSVTRGQALQELAQAVSRLPGVEHVILGSVQLAPTPAGSGGVPSSGLRIED